jgi:hypothetical protein
VLRAPLGARVRYGAKRTIQSIASWGARAAVAVARVAFRVALLALAAAALWLIAYQPLTEPMDHDALIAMAGIVATVLSLGLTVTLLVAQHTAERHARVLYAEFRREGAWLRVLGLLAVGVAVIIAASLARPTVSTGWASLGLAVALGLYAASLLPRMFDSLDATVLAERLTDRTVRELRDIARRRARYDLDPALKSVARHGLEIASVMAGQGVTSNDKEVVRAGYAGMRRVLVAYVEGSPTRGWDTEVINLAFQHLSEVTDRCVKLSPVLILPAALEELTALGVESQRTLEEDGPEAISSRLNSLFLEVVAQTLTNDQSPAPAMATIGIGESGLALIRAGSPNMVADHIRRLGSIALGAMRAERDHVAGQAHVELAKLALGLASMDSRDVMPPSLYQDACEALSASVDAFVERASTSGKLANDWAWMWTTMPWMQHNLARVVVAGIAADSRTMDGHRSYFAYGATALVHSMVKLATHGKSGFSTQTYAAETAYMAVLGAMALKVDEGSPDLIPELWATVVRGFVDPGTERLHEIEMLSSLLLAGAYEAESSRPTAPRMREGVTEALALTMVIADDFHRTRRARAWLGAGRTALGYGDDALAEAIAAGIAPDLRELRAALDGHPWRGPEGFFNDVFLAGQAVAFPELPDAHTRPDVVAAFEVLLDKHERRRRRRRPPNEPPPSE